MRLISERQDSESGCQVPEPALCPLHHTASQGFCSLNPFFRFLGKYLIFCASAALSVRWGERSPRNAGVSWTYSGHEICVCPGSTTWLLLVSTASSGPWLREASSTLLTAQNKSLVAAWCFWSSGWVLALAVKRASLACHRAWLASHWVCQKKEKQCEPLPGTDQSLCHSITRDAVEGSKAGPKARKGLDQAHHISSLYS